METRSVDEGGKSHLSWRSLMTCYSRPCVYVCVCVRGWMGEGVYINEGEV